MEYEPVHEVKNHCPGNSPRGGITVYAVCGMNLISHYK